MRRFVQALLIDVSRVLVADDGAVIEARRTIRELAPTLFAAHILRREAAASPDPREGC